MSHQTAHKRSLAAVGSYSTVRVEHSMGRARIHRNMAAASNTQSSPLMQSHLLLPIRYTGRDNTHVHHTVRYCMVHDNHRVVGHLQTPPQQTTSQQLQSLVSLLLRIWKR